MPLPKDRIKNLLDAYTSKTATPAQEEELMNWVLESQVDDALRNYMQEVWSSFQSDIHSNKVNWDDVFEKIMQEEKVVPIMRVRKMNVWTRVAAAAAILLLISAGGYFYFSSHSSKEIVKTSIPNSKINDVAAPSSNKAVLTLADGRVIELDSAGQGALAIQGSVNVEKTADGQIVYKGEASEIKMNTLSVPRGSKPVHLVLADGSKVWLNVASSITYPTAFAGDTRKVNITGEAYFEIATSLDPRLNDKVGQASKGGAKRPFIVQKGDMSVRVLGTHFNVNTYEDDGEIKVTLLEGAVNVSVPGKSAILKPGQQAQLQTSDNNIQTANDVNIDEVMAWKNGKFYFEKADIKTVMNQISRWYDVDVEYKGIVSEHFGGTVSKNVDASKVFEMLELTGGVNFKIEGKKIIVMP